MDDTGFFAPDKEIMDILEISPLDYVKDTLDDWIVGEDSNKITLFLSKLSYLMSDPTHELIRGESGAGKSYLGLGVLEAFPSEDVIKISRVTPAWADYSGKDLTHKIIFVQQLGGAESSSDAFHILLSERGLRIGTVVKEGSRWKSIQIEAKGPVSFTSTTTNLDLDPQMETRTFSLTPDESKKQTEAIQNQQAHFDAYPWEKEKAKERVTSIQKVIRFLRDSGITEVIMPFSELVKLPSEKIRIRRDRPKLITLVKSLALLRQMNRRIIEYNGVKYVVAEWQDFLDVVEMCGGVIAQTITELTKKEEEIIETIKDRYGSSQFDTNQLTSHIDLSSPTVRRYLGHLVEKRYLNIVKGGGRSRRNIYSLDIDLAYSDFGLTISDLVNTSLDVVHDHVVNWEQTIGEEAEWYRYDAGRLVVSK